MQPDQLCVREVPCERATEDVPVLAGEKLTGYAVVWGVKSRLITEDGSQFFEIIEKDSLDMSGNVKLTFQHRGYAEYADTKSGTLRLTSDNHGLHFSADLPPYAEVLRHEIASGRITGMSFGFFAREVEVDSMGVRHVRKAVLHHVSPVYTPAYPQTAVAVTRSVTSNYRMMLLDLASRI